MKRIPGFDYTSHKEVAHTRAEWRALVAALNSARAVQEHGETMVFNRPKGASIDELAFEIYQQGVLK